MITKIVFVLLVVGYILGAISITSSSWEATERLLNTLTLTIIVYSLAGLALLIAKKNAK